MGLDEGPSACKGLKGLNPASASALEIHSVPSLRSTPLTPPSLPPHTSLPPPSHLAHASLTPPSHLPHTSLTPP